MCLKMFAFIAFVMCLLSISASWQVRNCDSGSCTINFDDKGIYSFMAGANDIYDVRITPRFPDSKLDLRNAPNLQRVQIDDIDLSQERMCDALICHTPPRNVIVESGHKSKYCCLDNTSGRTAEASVRRQTTSPKMSAASTPADSTTKPMVKSPPLTTAEASVRRQTTSPKMSATSTPADITTKPTVKSALLTTVFALSGSTGFCIIVIAILFIAHKKKLIRLKRLEIRLDGITAEMTSSTSRSTAPLVRSTSDPVMSSTRLSEISVIDASVNTSPIPPVHKYPTRLQTRAQTRT